jgi:RNA-directed DNA polymerase
VISPLLANIALNGIEAIHPSVRYADDRVFFLKPEDDATAIRSQINHFLALRGLHISPPKTKLTATRDGFDFLGWHFQVQSNGKFRSVPSQDNFAAFRKKVKAIVHHSNQGAQAQAQQLAPLVRGWRNYHRFCRMKGSRNSLYFIETRTFARFNQAPNQNRYSAKKLLDRAFPKVSDSENKHINVRGAKSPFDGDLPYWSARNSKLYDGQTSKALNRQHHTCASCGHPLRSDERVHLHHLNGNHDDWNKKNLIAIHESCHDLLHRSKG